MGADFMSGSMMGKGGGFGKGCKGGCKGAYSFKGGDEWGEGWAEWPAKRQKVLSADAKPDVQQVLGQFLGIIKSFNSKNGFGFISCEALQQQGYTNDVYLHHNQVGGFQPGQTIMFTAYLNKKGQPQAMDLQPAM